MGVMKNRLDGSGEAGFAVVAMMPLFLTHRRGSIRFAIRADWLAVPANLFNMGDAVGFGREDSIDLDYVHRQYPATRYWDDSEFNLSCQLP